MTAPTERELLQDIKAFLTEPAGLQEDVVRDKDKFTAFLDESEVREKALLARIDAHLAERPAEPARGTLLTSIGTGDTPEPWSEDAKARLLVALKPYSRAEPMSYAADVMEEHGWHELAHDSAERLAWSALRIEAADPTPARGTVEVPVEPTEAMLDAGYAAMMLRKALSDVYKAMVDARPGVYAADPALQAWSDDVALRGPDAPRNNGKIKHLIEYLLTVYKRFGDTAITCNLQWGASACWKRDEQAKRIVELETDPVARPLSEWHEDHGEVTWWKFPVEEPSYIGNPLCDDWPGYHTHWTPHPKTSGPKPE